MSLWMAGAASTTAVASYAPRQTSTPVLHLAAAILLHLLLASVGAETVLTSQQKQIYEALLPLHMADVPVTEHHPGTCASSHEDMELLYKV
jgi:hypothetical protein